MVEQSAVNRWVVGSSPTSGASFSCVFWTYILQNDKGRFYVGHTEDLETRLEDHNRPDAFDGKFTRKNGPWRLVWSELHPTRALAMAKERQIKAMKSSRWIRETLLNSRVPTCRD